MSTDKELMPRYGADWYKSALNAMHDMVLIKGPQAQMLWANSAFLNFYGMSEEELFDLVDAEHSDPDNTLQYVIDDQTVVETGQHLDIPREIGTNLAGENHAVHTIKSPIFYGDDVVRTIGVSRWLERTDLAQRGDHADAKAFVEPLKVLTRSFPNPMMMVDVKARVIHNSPLWAASFGDVEITPNSYFRDMYAGLEALADDIDACLQAKTHCQKTVTIPEGGRGRRMYSVRISPWMFANGVLGGATVIATDISDLHQKTKELQSANEELTQYAYRASHDLKGPISTAKGLANFIMEDIAAGDLDEAAKNACKIITMMDRLDHNVKSMLDLARADLEVGEASAVDLCALLNEICDGLSAHSAYAGVSIEDELDVQYMRSQPVRLRQIMENLIANSIRYHAPDRNEKFVRVRSSQSDASITIEVEDNGRGIPEEAGARIFDRFTRFNQDSEGSGLGLAIVKKNVEALRGEIHVQSSAAGTAIRVTVPRADAEEALP
ncbi:MAG: PAS domain-containing sensor histidine kinase [Pseudomonadota bacterium]